MPTAARPSRHSLPRRIVEVTDQLGEIVEPVWLHAAQDVHRQLRPQLPRAYEEKMRRVFAGGGRMVLCIQGKKVCGLAVFRIHENTHNSVHMYVDDLVTDERQRSAGVGKSLLKWLERRARQLGCTALTLDSGTQRRRAHAFYLREGMFIVGFHFDKSLTETGQ
jgi:GNAT superfamily N-acetyltransferase